MAFKDDHVEIDQVMHLCIPNYQYHVVHKCIWVLNFSNNIKSEIITRGLTIQIEALAVYKLLWLSYLLSKWRLLLFSNDYMGPLPLPPPPKKRTVIIEIR